MLIGDGTRMLKNETNWHRMLILLRTLNKYQIYLLRNLNRILQKIGHQHQYEVVMSHLKQ